MEMRGGIFFGGGGGVYLRFVEEEGKHTHTQKMDALTS